MANLEDIHFHDDHADNDYLVQITGHIGADDTRYWALVAIKAELIDAFNEASHYRKSDLHFETQGQKTVLSDGDTVFGHVIQNTDGSDFSGTGDEPPEPVQNLVDTLYEAGRFRRAPKWSP